MTSFRKVLGFGILYNALAKYSYVIISIIIGAILARLLTPKEFGIVALITVFINFFNLISDFGIGPAVVQNQSLTGEDIESIFSFSLIFGIILAVLFFFASSLIANFYNEPRLVLISRLLSLSVLFNSVQIIPRALLQKSLKFKQIGIVIVSVQIFSGITAIIMAFSGFSFYSLVFKSILSSFFTLCIFYWLVRIKITLRIKKAPLIKIMRFSTYQFLFNFINYFSRNADNILIGKFFNSASLGYYDKSYQTMMLPIQNLTHVITPVLMPVLSKHENDKIFVFNTYLKVVRILATIGFPLSVFLYFSANEIIFTLYGHQWGQSIPVFEILALTVGVQMVLSSSGSIFQAINRTDLLLISGILSAIMMVLGISYGIFIGHTLSSVGYGLMVAFCINFFQSFYILINKGLESSLLKFFNVMVYPIFISLVIGVLLYIYSNSTKDPNMISLIVKIIISLFIFGVLFLLPKDNRNMITNILKK